MTLKFAFLIISILLILLSSTQYSFASEVIEEIDEITTDAEEESGSFLKKDWRFVPVPIPISNPTIGTGLAVAGLYLHPQKESASSQTTLSGLLGMYTSTDSWATGIFHDGFYFDDKTRLRGYLAYGEFNLKFYGIGDDSIIRDNPIDYNAKTIAFSPRALFRLPLKNWFLGATYTFLKIDNTFDFSSILLGLPAINIPTQTAGLGLVAVYDSRNNNLWPSDGTWFEFTGSKYGSYAGGDFEYSKINMKFSQYFPFKEKYTFVYRIDGQFIDGDAPFYDLSQINLRGFPMGLYTDNYAVTLQAEGRWEFHERWTGLLFGGAGRIADNFGDLGSSTTHFAGGVGIRYMINREQKLNIGVDLAYGNNTFAFYVQIGDWLAN